MDSCCFCCSVAHLLSRVQLFVTPCCSTPGFPVHHQLPELAQTPIRWVGDAIQPPHPLSPPSPPALNLTSNFLMSQLVTAGGQSIGASAYQQFSNESARHIRWPKYWSFSFSINPSNEYSGLISFRIDWFDLIAVQGTLKSFLQHHRLKASVLRHAASFMVQLSHPYMTTGKTTALTIRTFVGKVMSLCFNCCLGFSLLLFQGASIF